MAYKYIRNVAGIKTETEGLVTSAGAGDAGKIPALDSSGKLDTSLMPTGIGADTTVVPASENLAAGDFINLWNDTGTVKARKADATTTGKECHGFVLSAVTAPANATIYREGTNTQLSGLTAGSRYYLATTAGQATTTAPSSTGNILQYLGIADSTTRLNLEADDYIVLA